MKEPPSNNGSYLTQFIEYQQYFLGSFFNEIGLNANFNMKRESIAKSESSLNEDSMLPLCQNMLMCRQQDIAVVNEMFGLNIKVSFDSAWLQNALEIALELKALANEANGQSNIVGFGNNGANPISQQEGNNDEATEENQNSEGSEAGDDSSGSSNENEGSADGNAEEEGTPAEESVDELIDNIDEQIRDAAMLNTEEDKESEEKDNESDQ